MTHSFSSPVQIARVTRDVDATETALTTLFGVRKWVRVPDVHFAADSCSDRGTAAEFVAHISLSYLGKTQLELIEPVPEPNVHSDFLRCDARRLRFAHVCAPERGVPFVEIAHVSAQMRGLFDYVKQEQERR